MPAGNTGGNAFLDLNHDIDPYSKQHNDYIHHLYTRKTHKDYFDEKSISAYIPFKLGASDYESDRDNNRFAVVGSS